MNRAAIAAAIALAACTSEATHGDAASAPAAPTSAEAPPPPPPVAVTASAAPAPPAAPVDRRGGIELSPSQGDLPPLLKLHVARAKEKGLTPYVEFYANWCPPCKALKRYSEHPALVDAFQGTYIILLDADDWADKVKGTGFVSKAIPVFFALGDDGKPTGRKITGDAWGKRHLPETMAPVLKAFFAGS